MEKRREYAKKSNEKRYQQAVENGLCLSCRSRVPEQGKTCANCESRHRSEHTKQRKKAYHANLLAEALAAYGAECACCGETNPLFLTFDHTRRDGAAHRRELKSSGTYVTILWARKNNWPDTLQILCYNCNMGRERNNGVCPHKEYRT